MYLAYIMHSTFGLKLIVFSLYLRTTNIIYKLKKSERHGKSIQTFYHFAMSKKHQIDLQGISAINHQTRGRKESF